MCGCDGSYAEAEARPLRGCASDERACNQENLVAGYPEKPSVSILSQSRRTSRFVSSYVSNRLKFPCGRGVRGIAAGTGVRAGARKANWGSRHSSCVERDRLMG